MYYVSSELIFKLCGILYIVLYISDASPQEPTPQASVRASVVTIQQDADEFMEDMPSASYISDCLDGKLHYYLRHEKIEV